MLQRFFVILLLLISCTTVSMAQKDKMDHQYEAQWRKIDSLMDRGLPKSAEEVANKVLKDALAANDSPNAIKAKLFLISANTEHEEHAGLNNIKKAEAFIEAASGVDKALWQSITAGMYQAYFQQNRWKFYNRTALAETKSDDPDTWDAPAFFKKISSLYQASIADRESLKEVPVSNYTPILVEGVHTRYLRPSLYDLLVFRAIAYFQNEEKSVADAADQFEMEGAMWFDDAARFSELKVKVKNGESPHFQALRLYQEVIGFHLKDQKPDALIDADLQRLDFVHQYSVHPAKDSLYLAALQKLEKKYAGAPAVAQVSYLIAVQMLGEESPSPYNRGQAPVARTPRKYTIPDIVKKLDGIVAAFPKTEGAINAGNLARTLRLESLSVKAEEVNIPGEPLRAMVSYKNINNIYLKVYRRTSQVNIERYDNNTDELIDVLAKGTPVAAWQQSLPGTADMEAHNTEIKVNALPSGSYVLMASMGSTLDKSGNVAAVRFQVSQLSFVHGDGGRNGYILDRKTGYPVPSVKARFWSQQYNNKKSRYEAKGIGSATGNAEGVLLLPETERSNYESRLAAITLTSGSDTLQLGGYFNIYTEQNSSSNTASERTFVFTDRALYRPGQVIYFKGIMLESSNGGRSNNVLKGRSTTVTLHDANGQKVTSMQLKTNDFGSFSGKFNAPEGLLGGQMRISNESGSTGFSVEEYKRPKFYVAFDTLKGSYALSEQVKVKGFAKAYAGNNIDGAAVKYRVVRQARFPYYWCFYRFGMPSSPSKEISNGTVTTKEDGSFDIEFSAMPDKSIDPKALPVFTYTVYADITDINGETRSGNVGVQAGYTSLQIETNIAEDSKPNELKTVNIRTENLNGIFTAAKIKVSVSRLEFPGFLRKRLWETPDQFAMTEAEFKAAFPNDEYKDESNYLNWKKGKLLHETSFTTTAEGTVSIPEATWYQNGWYVIEISTRDAQGHDILEKKYTHVWAPGKKESNQKDILAYTDKSTYEPGEEAALWLATAADNPYLLRSSTKPYAVTNPIRVKITEDDRGGLAYAWMYVYNNRVYRTEKTVNVPWSNKQLQLEWATHRDKLQPGASEEWTLTIKGSKKEKVAAELLAGMYDASLDAFRHHNFYYDRLFPSVYSTRGWNSNFGFAVADGMVLRDEGESYEGYEKEYDRIISWDGSGRNLYLSADFKRSAVGFAGNGGVRNEKPGAPRQMRVPEPTTGEMEYRDDSALNEVALSAPAPQGYAPSEATPKAIPLVNIKNDQTTVDPIQIRSNLNETAFFFPQLATDAQGNVRFKFTIPEALTEWKMMAFAHTQDWKTGFLEGKVKTQKDLMVVPNLPRFLRQNDDIVISAKISNLSDVALNGEARIELIDAITMEPISLPSFQKRAGSTNSPSALDFSAPKGQSTSVNWTLHVPESRYTPVIIRIVAKAGNFSDGEETTLPVITNRTLVTETLPMPVRGNEEKTFTLDKLLNQQSNTLSNHGLTVEFTGNPAWYAVQALPYLMEYPYECAEQTFNRFYANALAGHIVAQSPKVEKIFAQWQQTDTAALLSNLQKNQELKSALLEETPWVMEAKDENEQKRRIASLFETHKLASGLRDNLRKLEQMQLGEGGFPWFKGMQSDRYITQYIMTGIARLQHLNVKSTDDNRADNIVDKALPYLDRKIKEDYDYLVKNKSNLELQHIGYSQIQYLYMRSFYAGRAIPAASQKAFDYYKKQATQYWSSFNPYLKGQLSLALQRFGDAKTPQQIVASLNETATKSEEMGMYWKNMPNGYWWYEAPIEAQSLLVETYSEVAKDVKAVDDLKVWLLKQKQTQNWKTTKATADACYALLLNGSDWLSSEPLVTINLGNEVIRSSAIKTEAGTGYFKKKYAGLEVKKEMGNIKVKVETPGNKNEGVSWGAVYWQYFEDLDKITASATPLSLKKQLFIERNTGSGPVLTEIKDGNDLQVGDKVKVRIELRADRDMEYVHMKDMRAACFEPVNVLSQYKYQGGLGYYESTKDVSTNFFFDYLRKGTYVFEYPVFVAAKGNFSNGISTIQCMYAPEFSSHSEGIRVEVK